MYKTIVNKENSKLLTQTLKGLIPISALQHFKISGLDLNDKIGSHLFKSQRLFMSVNVKLLS